MTEIPADFAALFRDPPAAYRGAPFWAWNCMLDEDAVREHVAYFAEMGFGGFHIHSRTGMAVPYLQEDFMCLTRLAIDEAKKRGMRAYLYDEDRWPSGAAGGLATKHKPFRARRLVFTPEKPTDTVDKETAVATGGGYFLAAYRVTLHDDGTLAAYTRVESEATGEDVWYAFCRTEEETPWHNNQTYLDTMNAAAVDCFIHETHDRYFAAVGDEFGKAVPSIFTDEPQPGFRRQLAHATDRAAVEFPWTPDFPATYAVVYGADILDSLPELVWDLPQGALSKTRLWYHNHVTDRFVEAFIIRCSAWCEAHGLGFTGHVLGEDSLFAAGEAVGDIMRCYPYFPIPGIDMLCDEVHLNTAKQVQSAARQQGAREIMSELYGVTNWDFDFRGHKFQGDWQAALGVTLRVPHLSWTSMEGEAKRDYPASISYQSPWYTEYRRMEDHYARLGVALTQGEAQVSVAVVHPIESYFTEFGPKDTAQPGMNKRDADFKALTHWLLRGQVDFDFLCEATLPRNTAVRDGKLCVGEMVYDTVILPNLKTLRSTTLAFLREFAAQGGRVLVAGDVPVYIDGEPCVDAAIFTEKIPYTAEAVRAALESKRYARVTQQDGTLCDEYIGQIRRDGDAQWVFFAPCVHPDRDYAPVAERVFTFDGHVAVTRLDTFTGAEVALSTAFAGGRTVVRLTAYPQDSFLFRLTPASEPTAVAGGAWHSQSVGYTLESVTRAEPNVLLLDRAQWALDDEPWQAEEEILRLDNAVRERLGYPLRFNKWAQPWVTPAEAPSHTVTLRYTVKTTAALCGVKLALERREDCTVRFNGERVDTAADGYYVDRCIDTLPLPPLCVGENVLELTYAYGIRSGLEAVYLLGDFAVAMDGTALSLQEAAPIAAFGSTTVQGMPFYGGNLTYTLSLKTTRDGALKVLVPCYRGALVAVELDGKRRGEVVIAPYTCQIDGVAAGDHTLTLTLYGNRFNTFGALHNCDPVTDWYGPNYWRSTGENWTYEYLVRDTGILSAVRLMEVVE